MAEQSSTTGKSDANEGDQQTGGNNQITNTQQDGKNNEITNTQQTGGNDQIIGTQQAGENNKITNTQQAGRSNKIIGTQQAGKNNKITNTQQAGRSNKIIGTQQVGENNKITNTQQAGGNDQRMDTQQAGGSNHRVTTSVSTEVKDQATQTNPTKAHPRTVVCLQNRKQLYAGGTQTAINTSDCKDNPDNDMEDGTNAPTQQNVLHNTLNLILDGAETSLWLFQNSPQTILFIYFLSYLFFSSFCYTLGLLLKPFF